MRGTPRRRWLSGAERSRGGFQKRAQDTSGFRCDGFGVFVERAQDFLAPLVRSFRQRIDFAEQHFDGASTTLALEEPRGAKRLPALGFLGAEQFGPISCAVSEEYF